MTQFTGHPSAPGTPRWTNRLAMQTSPYLLQHAHNPVDWWPWGEAAFAEARRRNVPIFLSIGYSTCYWCHVMERESFEHEATAAVMNELFVCIKLDREERPDVDDIYMAATVTMNGHGGWPMSVFLEPHSLRPFWTGTYFPREPKGGMPSFTQVLRGMSQAWNEQREGVLKQSQEVSHAVIEQLAGAIPPVALGAQQVEGAVSALLQVFDRANGGFGGAPKFPQPSLIDFLLEVRSRAQDDATADAIDQAVRRTLDAMACGGLFDQVGGGFHRYSVDAHWIVPHFEKMLYDNALLADVYARAAALYTDPFYARIARRTFDYLFREMSLEGGGFASAQDAEVDGREGLNYLWTEEEVAAAIADPDDAAFVRRVYQLDAGANFRDPHHPGEPPRNVLRVAARPEKLARELGMSEADLVERLDRVNAAMLTHRDTRKQPHRDDKCLTSWNGLLISALARASLSLNEPPLYRRAALTAQHILDTMVQRHDGRSTLLRTQRAGSAHTAGLLEDSAMFAAGLIELARAAHHLEPAKAAAWTTAASSILESARRDFFDDRTGLIYDTRVGEGDLFVRTHSTHDGACPSGVSSMLNALIDMGQLTSDKAWTQRAVQALAAFSGRIAESPVGCINSARALYRLLVSEESTSRDLALAPAAAGPGAVGGDPAQHVEIYAATDRVLVGTDVPAEFTLVVKIDDGFHVPAADPGESRAARALLPFRVGIVGGQGVTAYAGYPPGELLDEGEDQVRVYTGTFELPVALELSGDWHGRPLVCVMYQACSDRACMKPATVELDIAIDQLAIEPPAAT